MPGSGHLYPVETLSGHAPGTGNVDSGIQRRNHKLRSHELNSLVMDDEVYALSFFNTYRSVQQSRGRSLDLLGVDDAPLSQLALAPFQPAQLRSPEVWGAGLVGALSAAVASRKSRRTLSEAESVDILGQEVGGNESPGLTVSSMSLSLGAAVSEEAVFRGWLQPTLQRQLGPNLGLWSSAAAFGLAHIVGPDGQLNPHGMAFATVAGAYFGQLYNAGGNRLAKPVAAHFWYNFMLVTVGWALNPEETPLGITMTFDL